MLESEESSTLVDDEEIFVNIGKFYGWNTDESAGEESSSSEVDPESANIP
jgi:hypothetical protein